jgi:putative N6-adenine-specific DNA methylase
MGQAGTVERLFLQASPGLEGALEREARTLGRARTVAGGVLLEGPPGIHAEANLVLRVAERVLLRVVEAPARSWKEAMEVLGAVAGIAHPGAADAVDRIGVETRARRGEVHLGLDAVLQPGAPLVLESTVRLPGAPRSAEGVAAAVTVAWKRPVSAPRGAERAGGPARLVLRASGGRVELSADTSGALLHRRGWRQEVSRAPMRETLAAGVLAIAGPVATEPLWDPMCGSGTLLIEGALAARRMAPGLGRRFAAEDWPVAPAVDWAARRRRLESQALAHAPAPLVGTDLNAGSLGTARRNARRAGVLDDLRLERLDVAAAAPGKLGPGLLVANLPYGIRVGERHSLATLDAALARTLVGPFASWRVALLVDDARRLERMGRGPPVAMFPLRNGGIPVVLGVWSASSRSGPSS